MAKKKNETASEAVVVEAQAVVPPPPANTGNGEHRRPDQSWSLHSDRTTCIDVACWINLYQNQQGEPYEQVTVTVARSYKDAQGEWHKGGAWRTHDLPCLMFLLQKAHDWALERRIFDSSMPF